MFALRVFFVCCVWLLCCCFDFVLCYVLLLLVFFVFGFEVVVLRSSHRETLILQRWTRVHNVAVVYIMSGARLSRMLMVTCWLFERETHHIDVSLLALWVYAS